MTKNSDDKDDNTIAFLGGKSVRTKDVIEKTKQAGKLVYVFDFYGNRISSLVFEHIAE